MRQDWSKWVIVKQNAAAILTKELDKLKKKLVSQLPDVEIKEGQERFGYE